MCVEQAELHACVGPPDSAAADSSLGGCVLCWWPLERRDCPWQHLCSPVCVAACASAKPCVQLLAFPAQFQSVEWPASICGSHLLRALGQRVSWFAPGAPPPSEGGWPKQAVPCPFDAGSRQVCRAQLACHTARGLCGRKEGSFFHRAVSLEDKKQEDLATSVQDPGRQSVLSARAQLTPQSGAGKRVSSVLGKPSRLSRCFDVKLPLCVSLLLELAAWHADAQR